MKTLRQTVLVGVAALLTGAMLAATAPTASALETARDHGRDSGHPKGHGKDHDRGHPKGKGHASEPYVIAHRGASGYRPEHTLAAYRLAIRQGADVIEPDLVITRDGVLVARHENEIGGTTDVADHPEFADRRTTKTIDGRAISGWFTEDFTLAELKTLRAKERLPQVRPANTVYDGRYEVPTLAEVIDLAARASRRTGRTIEVVPETKHPTYFASIGLDLSDPLVRLLRQRNLDGRRSPVTIQSFEVGNLADLSRRVRNPLALNVSASGQPYDYTVAGNPTTYADLVKPAGLKKLSRFIDIVSAEKNVLIPRDANGYLTEPTDVIDDAHRFGLEVVSWTFRAENQFLAADFRIGTDPNAIGDLEGEVTTFLRAGIDGLFSDHPDIAVAARDSVVAR
ncbi:glycerophosphoryl diester phosphodiesterase [Mumia flava]|uniref:glycerophosphodiester phosphodiesterase n=1 Tax=Mumia flava TaxID=1348852 RepID=A0A0B2B3T6_9ACTN|nr:glycerophosphodiester phosphodiesterase [Mumia flava]PJJ56811.1 glycerophosphoryl diester phosphodiesterase [Mumia flava]